MKAWLIAFGLFSLVGCGSLAGNASNGKVLFNRSALGTGASAKEGCVMCHAIEAGISGKGPSLAGYGSEAGEHYKDHQFESAVDYVVDTMVNPDGEIASGFSAGVMPKYSGILSEQELADLAAYLLTL